jgi:hypothetical protein
MHNRAVPRVASAARASRFVVSHPFVRATLCTLLGVVALPASRARAVEIQFDYSRDATGFFSGPANEVRRQRLEQAALAFKPFTDQLRAIIPSGSNHFSGTFANPVTGDDDYAVGLNVPANTMVIFVGARDWGDSRPAYGQFGGFIASGDPSFVQDAVTRGQAGVDGYATDFARWGGYISFDETRVWNFGDGLPAADETDFLSAATREIAHVLGFGTSPSWINQSTGEYPFPGFPKDRFIGPASTAVYGQSFVPLDFYGDWQQGLQSGGHEVLMDATLVPGTRKSMTPLDYAGMSDVGWQIPEPSTLGGLAVLALAVGRRRRNGET